MVVATALARPGSGTRVVMALVRTSRRAASGRSAAMTTTRAWAAAGRSRAAMHAVSRVRMTGWNPGGVAGLRRSRPAGERQRRLGGRWVCGCGRRNPPATLAAEGVWSLEADMQTQLTTPVSSAAAAVEPFSHPAAVDVRDAHRGRPPLASAHRGHHAPPPRPPHRHLDPARRRRPTERASAKPSRSAARSSAPTWAGSSSSRPATRPNAATTSTSWCGTALRWPARATCSTARGWRCGPRRAR